MSDLLKKTAQYIKKKELLDLVSGFRVVIGVSGGADSVCLLLLLNELAKDCGGTLTAVHINHQLRGKEAEADQAFVEDLCKTLGISLQVFTEDAAGYARKYGLTVEEAGRKLRYARLSEAAKAHDAVIAVAHNLEDNAETILFHLIRGADLKGISGMKPKIQMEDCTVIRPLLEISRKEIEAYLESKGQPYCVDATNEDVSYSRNRIRHRILKEMKELNPKAAEHICKAAESVGEAEEFIRIRVRELFLQAAKVQEQEVSLDARLLAQAKPMLSDGVIYEALRQVSMTSVDLSSVHVADIKKLFGTGSGKRIVLSNGLEAVRIGDQIVIRKRQNRKKPPFAALAIPLPDAVSEELVLPDGRKVLLCFVDVSGDEKKRNALIEKKKYTKAFDYDKIMGSLFIGSRQPGDKITINEGTKRVSRFMIDEHIPAEKRDEILILRDEKEVLWIVGFRISETCKLTDKTRRALVVTIQGSQEDPEEETVPF